ncbi:unnamed protein product [Adineta ricciae]|uniref:G-protein coupled receptors family 1 profile domain-containing protein n=1 Tax=Adineta ricciae TaxID=249248 RepID=A0A814X5U6_ADIRI|nr:unnamed protein product [Adineta ricciae]CAF1338969.1 unnamed protein product [Adineta ricciae]
MNDFGDDSISSSQWKNDLFAILLTGQLLSIPCYLFLFYHLLRDKLLWKNLQNHSIVLLLIYNFLQMMIDLSMTLNFYRVGHQHPLNVSLCFLHGYVDYGIWYGALHIMFWNSIERHILIFYSNFLRTARQRILFHYIPLGFVSSYAPILYFYLIVLCPCQRFYNGFLLFCGVVCYSYVIPQWFSWFESLMNCALPILFIGVFSWTLIIRVILQKRRLQQAVNWRRQRKMIIQLASVSIIYLAFSLPYVIATVTSWLDAFLFDSYTIAVYIGAFAHMPAIVMPYANLVALSPLKPKLAKILFWKPKQQRTVAPSART